MIERSIIDAAVADPQVQAFRHVLGCGESFADLRPEAYTLTYGGGHFTDFSHHPYDGIPTTEGGLASGAYGYLGTTWKLYREKYNVPNFKPAWQDWVATADICEHGALGVIQAGDVETAIKMLAKEWVSLPGLGKRAEEVFTQYGGKLAGAPEQVVPPSEQPAAPIEEREVQPAPEQKEVPVGAIATFLPLIMQLIPALTGIKGLQAVASGATPPDTPAIPQPLPGGSLHAADYVGLAQVILDTFVKAVPGAANPAMAVGMAQADPAVAAQASAAVLAHPDVAAQLNALVPVMDKVAQYDKDTWAATMAGANAATMRAIQDPYDVAPIMVKNVTNTSSWMVAGLVVGIVLAMLLKVVFTDAPDWATTLIPVLTFMAGQYMKERGAIISYRFDGTPSSNATAMANQQLNQLNAMKP